MQIYEINKEVKKALDLKDEEQRDYLLGQLKLNLADKSDELLKACKNIELFNQGVDAEIERLQALKDARNKQVSTIKELIKNAMEDAGLKTLGLPKFKLTVAKTPPRVVIENEALVPADYWITKEVNSIDKKLLKEALRNCTIEGARLETSTTLRIK